MLAKLPSWVVSNEESVRRETAAYRDMTLAERGAILYSVCEAAGTMAAHPDRFDRSRLWQDRLPGSSVQALSRLRAEYRRSHPE